jgi:hypothetical protein
LNQHREESRRRAAIERALGESQYVWRQEVTPNLRRRKLACRWFVRVGVLLLGVLAVGGLWESGRVGWAVFSGLLSLGVFVVAVAGRRKLPD